MLYKLSSLIMFLGISYSCFLVSLIANSNLSLYMLKTKLKNSCECEVTVGGVAGRYNDDRIGRVLRPGRALPPFLLAAVL